MLVLASWLEMFWEFTPPINYRQKLAQEPHNVIAYDCDLLVRVLDVGDDSVSAAKDQLVLAVEAHNGSDLVSQLQQAVGA